MTAFSDFRQNPWDSTFSDRVMDPEIHVVAEFDNLPGIYGIALQDRPVSGTVVIVTNNTAATPYTEVTTTPLSGQFRVDYVRGLIQFNSADDGDSVEVNYSGRGTNVSIALIEALIGAIASTFGTITASTAAGLIIEAANGTDAARFGNGNTSLSEILGDLLVNNKIRAQGAGGILIEAADGTDVATFGASNNPNASFNGVVSVPDGTAAAPAIKVGDEQNGLFSPGANELGFATGGAERMRILSTGQLQAVYESTVGTDYNTTLNNAYLCRAWVNFNGESTVAIRAAGNVSSITDHGTGQYTLNFSVALPDTDYNAVCSGKPNSGASNDLVVSEERDTARTTSTLRIRTRDAGANDTDPNVVSVSVFR